MTSVAHESTESRCDRPAVIVSLVETLALNWAAVFAWGCFDPDLRQSPRMDEWFAWAPEQVRFWLLNSLASTLLATVLCLTPLTLYVILASRFRWCMRIGAPGSPPLVGALVFLATAATISGFSLLAALED